MTRRGVILGAFQLGTGVVLALRLRQLQVEQADQFRLLAEENRINIRLIPPRRGLIVDRHGALLAGNEQNYRIAIVREEAGDVRAVLNRLAKIIDLAPAEIDEVVKDLERRSAFVPVTVAERVSWQDFSAVAVNAPTLPGIQTEVGTSRIYPWAEDTAHVVGYVGPVSDYDLERLDDPDPVLQIPRFQIGKVGVEARLEQLLRGKAGSRRIEVNAVGRVIREIDRIEGTPGSDVQLTLDAALQDFVQARLGEESAAAVVIDVRNGDILASASSPSFDPNKFVRGISVADYKALLEHDHRPLSNKAVQGAYPPGSTLKPVVAAAALEAGVIDPSETVYCPGFVEVAGRRFHCWRRGGHGHVDIRKSLQQSCDVFYYEMAQRLGIERIARMARRFGLGEGFDLPMSAVSEGLVPDKDWKRRKYGKDWLVGDTLNAAIGQGFVLTTPLQLAVMTARLASGRALIPRLVKSVDGVEVPHPPAPPIGVSASILDRVRDGMNAVSNTRRGTAFSSRIVAEGMEMAGKTGTSQVRNITKAERARGVFRNEDLPWERRDHGLFIAFAPREAPRFAVAVVVEHGGGGSTAAAPIARDIMLRTLYGDVPPLEAYPESQRGRIGAMLKELRLRTPPGPHGKRTRA